MTYDLSVTKSEALQKSVDDGRKRVLGRGRNL